MLIAFSHFLKRGKIHTKFHSWNKMRNDKRIFFFFVCGELSAYCFSWWNAAAWLWLLKFKCCGFILFIQQHMWSVCDLERIPFVCSVASAAVEGFFVCFLFDLLSLSFSVSLWPYQLLSEYLISCWIQTEIDFLLLLIFYFFEIYHIKKKRFSCERPYVFPPRSFEDTHANLLL